MATTGEDGGDVQFHTLHFRKDRNDLTLTVYRTSNVNSESDQVLTISLGVGISAKPTPVTHNKMDGALEFLWGNGVKLAITCVTDGLTGSGLRYDMKWTAPKTVKELRDSIHLLKSHWYGGGQVHTLKWPIEKWSMKLMPYVIGDSFKDQRYGGVLERYFLASTGASVFVDDQVPLFVSINAASDGRIVLSSKYESPYWQPSSTESSTPYLFLNYSLFVADSVRAVHELTAAQMISKPSNIPDELLFRLPIWSTWATYHRDINQQTVLSFADDISRHGFKAAQLEIDDDWTPSYGDMEFDKAKFPSPHKMMSELKEKGFRVTLWVHPFASIRSSAAGRSSYWLGSYLKGYTTWWNGVGKCLDVTNPAAVAWFKGCLQALKEEHGIASYKFDAGEINWLPAGFTSHSALSGPNDYSRRYAELCASVDPNLRALEVRVGSRTQHLPVFVRMMDKQSGWGSDNGLLTIIPHALTFGIIGYPFVLADMIGGNAYNGRPEKELYIRWVEVNALLPCIQFSIPPWDYDEEVVCISRKMLELHERYADLFITCAKECVKTGAPIIRPLWWIDPISTFSQTVDDEFLVGDDLLVAPVVYPSMTSRHVYLPPGRWRCQNTGVVLDGAQMYNDYQALLHQLPHFIRVKE